MSMGVPRIFDPRQRRRNLERAATARPHFLADALAGEIESRVSIIKRNFNRTLIHGPAAALVKAALAPERFGRIMAASQVREPDVDIVCGDEALCFAPGSFDCILSLANLQSINDIAGAFIQYRQMLRPDGLFLAAVFSGATLNELRASWLEAESELTGGAAPRVAPFADLRDLGTLMQRAGFALPVTDQDTTVVRYANPIALMREIKALGFGHALQGRSRRLVMPALFARAAAIYAARFSDPDGRIRATVDIAWCLGWAPDPSQQQPLKPGSARSRLADALKVSEHKLKRD
jgi:SAM-dependent methyltransferase